MRTTAIFELDDLFRRDLPALCVEWEGTPVAAPVAVVINDDLAVELGIDPTALRSPEGVAVLAGNATPTGATPVAMAYAGHQFGGYSPRLGDGRALLLGELVDGGGIRRDVHLKGSGRTPFARGGDGRAALGPMLREHLVSEAMHALGIPTTRALAVVATGEPVAREGPLPGAVLTRVAASHLRVGTFEYAARLGDPALLRQLADHAIARHHPAARDASEPHLALLEAVVEAQASLIARWMLVGFVHGVMNTDNTTISSETIDYGPCAFMDRYDPATVFSSIDRAGRYAYGNQPAIARWNLTRLAESLLPLIGDGEQQAVDAATEVLAGFADRFGEHWATGMAAKLGLVDRAPGDDELFEDLLEILGSQRRDFTGTFRELARMLRGDGEALRALPEERAQLDAWLARWHARLDDEGRARPVVADAMDEVNPVTIPRNHLVEEALEAATAGDLAPYHQLLDAVTHPFDEPADERYASPAPVDFDESYQTFCGT